MVQLLYGVICDIDAAKGLYKVNLDADKIVTDWLSVIAPRSLNDTESWPFELDEHVAALLDKDCERGIILGATFNPDAKPDGGAKGVWRKTFSDGAYIEYDKNSGKGNFTIKAKGDVLLDCANATVKATGKVKIDAPNTEMTGKLKVSGDIDTDGKVTAVQDIASTGGDVKAGIVTLKLHKHVVPVAAPGVSVTSAPAIP
jgi:phage baseplate assembly protein V